MNSAKWLLTYQQPVPAVGETASTPDPLSRQREAAAALLARTLTNKQADARLRNAALSLSIADATVRRNPTVKAALQPLQPGVYEEDPAEVKQMSAEWRKNYEYFRDWLMPEFLRPNRDDEMACMSCHGVAGRVPSMELRPADNRGYLSAANTLANYKILLERVSDTNVEQSKLLRKPLNVQSGKEDGHQGGRRYNPEDRAYEILRRWASDTARLKKAVPNAGGR